MNKLSNVIVKKIQQIIKCFETGKVVGSDYGNVSIYNDGPGNRRQVTYGASQTTEFGLLKKLITMYVNANGQWATTFKPYLTRIGDTSSPTLANDEKFTGALKLAGKDPIMGLVQDAFFMENYFRPALDWFEMHGFTLPLSMLVIYDSYVHSGSILSFLRNEFPAKLPSLGGDEKAWITQYVDVRDKWLEENTGRPILQKTDYRTDSFIYNIRKDNWMLDKPFQIVNYPDRNELEKPELRELIP